MPYNRYDIKNKYNRRGRRVNERVWLRILFLILIPVIIVATVILGIVLPLKQSPYVPAEQPKPSTMDESKIDEAQLDEELLRIVNQKYQLDSSFKPELVPFGNVKVAKIVFDDLDDLVRDAASDGVSIKVKTGYVSYLDQDKIYNEILKNFKIENSAVKAEAKANMVSAKAGESENQTGLLITFSTDEEGDFTSTNAFRWLSKYSVNYGFVLRFPEGQEEITGKAYDPATYRYVGIDHAKNMRGYGMTLEAYSLHVDLHRIDEDN